MGVARSGIGWFLASVVALGASWLASVYFTRALADPAATLGKFYLFETIVSFLALFANAGTNAAITKRISGATDAVTRERYVGAGLVVSATLLVVMTLVAVGALPLYSWYFEEGLVVGVFVIGLLVVLQVKFTATAILRGVSKVGRTGAVGLVDSGGRALVQVILVFLGGGLVGLMAGALVGATVSAVLAVAMIGVGVARPDGDDVRSIVSYAKNALVSGFTTKFYDNVDIVVISYFLGSAATGVYGIGFRFALPIKVFSGAINQTSLPEISSQMEQGNVDRVEEVLTDALIFSTLLAIPATVGVAILARPLIVTFYTGEFAGAAFIAAIAVGIQVPDGLRSVFSTTLSAIDRPDLPARSGFILIGTNLVLDLVLVPTVGPIGAIVASLAGITLATLYLGYHLFSELELGYRAFPAGQFGAELVAALGMGAVVAGLRDALVLPVVPKLAAIIPVGVGTYFLLVVALSKGIRQRLLGIARDFLPVDRVVP